MDTTDDRRPPTAAFLLTALLGLGVAAALGGTAAWWGEPSERWVRFAVFSGAAAVPAVSLLWVLVRARVLGPVDRRAEDSVENAWFENAAAGALLDLLTGCGLLLTLLSVTGTEVSGTGLLLVLLVAGFADVAVRFVAQRRAGS